MNYDNLINQLEAQALVLAMMKRDGRQALDVVTNCLFRFGRENQIPSTDLVTTASKLATLTEEQHAAISAFIAIMQEAKR